MDLIIFQPRKNRSSMQLGKSLRALGSQEADNKNRLGRKEPNHPTHHDLRIISVLKAETEGVSFSGNRLASRVTTRMVK